MDKIIVTVFGLIIISLTYWFFLGKKEKITAVKTGRLEIRVEGGYQPETIALPVNKPATIVFNRTDPSSCLEEVILPEFKIRKYLPLNSKTEIGITPTKTGTFPFSCGMNMYHGRIIVTK